MDWLGLDLEVPLRAVYGAAPHGELTRLGADASTRTYYRYLATAGERATGPESLLVMHLPQDALGSDEASGDERPTELPFLDVQRLLRDRGIRVPAVYHGDLPRRVVLLEDLGEETFADRLQRQDAGARMRSYERAVDLLCELHEACGQPGESIAYRRRFDRALLRWELDHFREWGLEAVHGPLDADERATLDAAFERLTGELLALPQGFVHRDYQSRNLMWTAAGELAVIDFQDALQGPEAYDLVALLCDSYVALSAAQQQALIERYARARGLSVEALRGAFDRVAVQRKLKDSGRFVYIDRVRHNAGFLQSYPQSLVYAGRALAALADYEELYALLRAHIPGFPDAVPAPASARA